MLTSVNVSLHYFRTAYIISIGFAFERTNILYFINAPFFCVFSFVFHNLLSFRPSLVLNAIYSFELNQLHTNKYPNRHKIKYPIVLTMLYV